MYVFTAHESSAAHWNSTTLQRSPQKTTPIILTATHTHTHFRLSLSFVLHGNKISIHKFVSQQVFFFRFLFLPLLISNQQRAMPTEHWQSRSIPQLPKPGAAKRPTGWDANFHEFSSFFDLPIQFNTLPAVPRVGPVCHVTSMMLNLTPCRKLILFLCVSTWSRALGGV